VRSAKSASAVAINKERYGILQLSQGPQLPPSLQRIQAWEQSERDPVGLQTAIKCEGCGIAPRPRAAELEMEMIEGHPHGSRSRGMARVEKLGRSTPGPFSSSLTTSC
jgi:hypothetical protein